MYGNSAMITSVSLCIFGMIFGGRHSHMKKKKSDQLADDIVPIHH